MSIDRSLRSSASLSRHRNVLTRAERVAKLEDIGKWVEGSSTVIGMPKVGNKKSVGGKKKKVKKEEETKKK
ncbi:MAG: small basic protein [Sedimentisphaerales bacterium]|nr:small basic protein [Sedimentisphaerales bacterium]MBN2844098.1 small basic protein [Sedimentisphaerales bacterium]